MFKPIQRAIITSLVLVGAVSGNVYATEGGDKKHHEGKAMHEGGGKHHGGYGMGMGHHMGSGDGVGWMNWMPEKLGLSKDQTAAVKDIMEKTHAQMKPMMDEMMNNHKALDNIVSQGVFNEAEVTRLAKAIGDAKAQMLVMHTKAHVDIYNLLDDKQKEKFKSMMDWRGKHHSS